MTEIIERSEVAHILADSRFLVPEADTTANSRFDRFRTLASRFANGTPHADRRARLELMLTTLRPAELAALATTRTRNALAEREGERVDVSAIARSVPVATLAAALGFTDADALPPLVAAIAGRYASGTATDAAAEELAITRLLLAAPQGADDDARVLLVQLLVQAFGATAPLVDAAMLRLGASIDPSPTTAPSTRELLLAILRDESPVPLTRRVAPDGRLVALRLDGPDGEAEAAGREPRTLAFGAGARACPAPHHALAIAAAIVDELRRARGDAAPSHAFDSRTEETDRDDAR